MTDTMIQRIAEYSDAYTHTLWNRFISMQANSPDEQKIFQNIHDTLSVSPDMPMPENLQALFPHEERDISQLPMSFFLPGATSDIFINCHSEIMNGFIHAHDFFEMIYICRGEIVDWVDGVEIPLKQGELCIHNPRAKNTIRKMKAGEDFVINILLPPELFQKSFYYTMQQNRQLEEFFHSFTLSPDSSANYMSFHNTSHRVDTIIELFADEFLRGRESSRFVLESTLVVLFGELIRNFRPDPFLQELIRFVQEHLSDICMETAAMHFGYHRNYFPHVVRQKTGRTFWDIVTDIRLQKATTLLLFSEQTIEQISESIGYLSTASFYQHFRERYGMTPKEYRRKNQKKPN